MQAQNRAMKATHYLFLTILLPLSMSGCGGSSDTGTTSGGVSPLIEVAEQGDLGALETLLKRHGEPDVRDSCDWTPLMKAALNGHREVVERLLAAGAEVDAVDKGGYTAMMLAASNNHVEIVNLLLEHGAMIDHQEDTHRWSALIWSINQGHVESVQTLLEHGADRTLKDDQGWNAIDWARESGRADLLALLQTS